MSAQFCSANLDNSFATQIALNSTAFIQDKDGVLLPIGNATEGALLIYLKNNGFDCDKLRGEYKVSQRILFNTERKFMASLVDTNIPDKLSLYVKGAPEVVLAMCKLDSTTEANFLQQIKEYQARGMRCLGFASLEIPLLEGKNSIDDIIKSSKLNYNGFAAIADPIRDNVKESMIDVLNAGIKVKIVTGDTSLTAIEIAKQAGLWGGNDDESNIITGVEFEQLPDDIAKERALKIKVMSRARPGDKMRLVRLLQESGEVVAVTGDGTNDAPALHYAVVGLAMGSGTAVAHEASDILLFDDSFSGVARAANGGSVI